MSATACRSRSCAPTRRPSRTTSPPVAIDARNGSRCRPAGSTCATFPCPSGARLENSVELAAILEHLPGACESRRDDERVSSGELAALAILRLDRDTSGEEMAQLVLGIANAPAAARR